MSIYIIYNCIHTACTYILYKIYRYESLNLIILKSASYIIHVFNIFATFFFSICHLLCHTGVENLEIVPCIVLSIFRLNSCRQSEFKAILGGTILGHFSIKPFLNQVGPTLNCWSHNGLPWTMPVIWDPFLANLSP